MLDMATTRQRTKIIQLAIDCPICFGKGAVAVPRHDGSMDNGFRDPSGMYTADIECGCVEGKLQLKLDASWLEDPLADAVSEAVDDATRGMHHDDRDYLRDDVSTVAVARELIANLIIQVRP